MLAYLVIRDGTKWSDVFRLVPGRTITIGRAPTNQIVIREEMASRNHAELFLTQGRWTIRDLDSRNGTAVGNERIHGDHPLDSGDVVRIANTQLAFVHDLSKAYADGITNPKQQDFAAETVVNVQLNQSEIGASATGELIEPTTITHRRVQTRFLEAPASEEDVAIPRIGQSATKLCRLAFELAKQDNITNVANIGLNGVLDATGVDAGAVLLLSRDAAKRKDFTSLRILASRSDLKPNYQRVSQFLAEAVVLGGEAVLARNIQGDSTLSVRDSKGEIHATCVICAPIRQGNDIIGIVHLYSTDPSKVLDPDDLEFSLAVAENVGLAITTLSRQQALVEDLSKSKHEINHLRQRLGVESEIIGSSEAMLQVHQQIARAAPSKATVLIRGESGVGKELVARAVHYSSGRRKGPFVCINCAALTETLLESELFGHEKGAFTGATERKVGKFEAADRGTLMLDEIGEMSPGIQAKFLRVLEGHPYERVGGSKPIKTQVRVIAATNRDLEKAVRDGTFRKDLYFRLRVVEVEVPPLRKRPEDIIELAQFFLQKFNAETGRKLRAFAPDALRRMTEYRWPGNVRELKNVIERAVVLSRSEFVDAEDLLLSNLATASESQDFAPSQSSYQKASLADVERRHILATLINTEWNKSQTATILGIERSTLDRKIKKYELARPTSIR